MPNNFPPALTLFAYIWKKLDRDTSFVEKNHFSGGKENEKSVDDVIGCYHAGF